MQKDFVLLVAHGSKDPKWGRSFKKIISKLKRNRVVLTYLEHTQPLLKDVLNNLIKQQKVLSIKVLPLFISGGRHTEKDIPKIVNKANKARNKVPKIKILPVMGEHPKIASAITKVIKQLS